MRAAIRSGSPAPNRIASSEVDISGQLRNHFDYIARDHFARRNDTRVQPAHAPARRSMVALPDAAVKDFILKPLAVDPQLRARAARLRDFQRGAARADLVADP